MGMLKEGVRLDRVRGGRQKYRRNPNMQPYQLQIPHSSSQPPQSLEDIKMLDVLASFEPEKLCVGHCGIDLMNRNDEEQKNECVGTDAQEMINVLSDLYDKELVGKNYRFEFNIIFSTSVYESEIILLDVSNCLSCRRHWVGKTNTR